MLTINNRNICTNIAEYQAKSKLIEYYQQNIMKCGFDKMYKTSSDQGL